MYLKFFTFLLLLLFNIFQILTVQQNEITDIAEEIDSRVLVFSTLNGYLYGVEQDSGMIRWKIKDKSIVKVPKESSDAIIPLFLPDPHDGSIYLIGTGKDQLKKLPFTIPELVTSSPCRSSDGILYTGKKKDAWFTIDPKTGNRQQVLGWDSLNGPTCPVQSLNSIYVGRTEYSLMMVDSKHSSKKWNISFYEYSAAPISKEALANYDLLHFSSSSTGLLVTMDRRRGTILWEKNFDSPVIGVYILDNEGLISIPYKSLSNHTLNKLSLNSGSEKSMDSQYNPMKLYPTIYIGEHLEGLYVIPSFVDQNMVTISTETGKPLLLEGPEGFRNPQTYVQYPTPGYAYPMPDAFIDPITFQSVFNNHILVHIGHYDIPPSTKTKLQINGNARPFRLLTDESSINKNSKQIQTDPLMETDRTLPFIWIKVIQISGVVIISVLIGFITFYYSNKANQKFVFLKRIFSPNSLESPEGLVQVGKITFNPQQLLGKGCDGTFVYRGEFDGRRVAVKRLLPECFDFADREVSLLRESDAHPNVIRYFCMEKDRMFRYIALELCQATLCDFVEGNFHTELISAVDILQQATSGLEHLHLLDIVHRDIKPQNVLLCITGVEGRVRAMISDFGLCKKLPFGQTSFSKRSGIIGTEGWIAPEVLNKYDRFTSAVDMFSLGCLFYYVLSKGDHPFGDSLRRQANILSGEYCLENINEIEWKAEIYKPLLKALISAQPSQRPTCKSVLNYPIFWKNSTILTYLQDVSDRVEKVESGDPVLDALESKANVVVKGDWRVFIDDEVASDLRKYRNYKGLSIRDLLRALRNKKHHFHDISNESREKLGQIPDKFVDYWTSRFPLLVIHTWLTMQCLSNEETFKQYYQCSTYFPMHLLNYSEHEANIDYDLIQTKFVEEVFNSPKPKVFKNKRAPSSASKNEGKYVGSYRNLKDVQNNVNNKNAERNNLNKSFKHNMGRKKPKPSDENLVWVLPTSNLS